MRLAWLLLLLLLALPARADDSEAKRHFDRGLISYNLQRYTEALEHFQAAYELKPAPQFLFNIGQCQRQLGQREAAVKSYRAYLRMLPDAPNREQALRFAAKMEMPAPAAAPSLAAPTPEPARAVEVAPPPLVVAAAPAARERPWYRKPAGWTLAGVGIALDVVAVGLAAHGNALDGQVRATNSLSNAVQLQRDRDSYENAGWALLSVGGAGLVAGVVVMALDATRGRRRSLYSRAR